MGNWLSDRVVEGYVAESEARQNKQVAALSGKRKKEDPEESSSSSSATPNPTPSKAVTPTPATSTNHSTQYNNCVFNAPVTFNNKG